MVKRLRIGRDNTVKCAGLLALGYLISHGQNPYKAEWNVRKALGIEENLLFNEAKDLYLLLGRHITQSEKPMGDNKMSLFADPTGEPANLGSTVSPKWESNPSTVPEEWHGFFPSPHPLNY